MKRILLIVALLGSFAFSQQQSTLSGIFKTEEQISADARIGLFVIDRDGLPKEEIAAAIPVAGTFSLQTKLPKAENLSVFRNGSILLPGLQNEYTVSPENSVNYAEAIVNMYVDSNTNQVFDYLLDPSYLGITYLGTGDLEEPIGFYKLFYVDKALSLTGGGVTLEFAPGWNLYTVRYIDEKAQYSVQSVVSDVVMDVFLP